MAANGPTLAGFIAFVRNVMGISTAVLPDASASIPLAYAVAIEIVNQQLAIASSLMYSYAVYNLGGDNLINYAQDLDGAPPVAGSDPPQAYFAYARKRFNIYGFVSGVIQSASDEATSESMVVQEAAKNFTLADLQALKTPWGRQYLAIAQKYGPAIWGFN